MVNQESTTQGRATQARKSEEKSQIHDTAKKDAPTHEEKPAVADAVAAEAAKNAERVMVVGPQ